ncbi:MAG: proton-conducting transporter membrane subunit [Pseudomonadota bacterium]
MAAAWIAWGPAGLVGLPLIGLFACLALPRWGHAIATATTLLVLALVVALGIGGGIGGATVLGGWDAPLGILLRLDALAWVFTAITAAVFALVTPAAKTALSSEGVAALWLGLLAGMAALFVSGDLFNLFVALEVAGLSAVALTAMGGDARAARAAFGYLAVSLTGGLLYLAAVALFYRATGTLDLGQVASAIADGEGAGAAEPGLAAALALATAGLLLKTGAAPMHRWLPPAHGAASPVVSALLSGIVVKGSLYILIRRGPGR